MPKITRRAARHGIARAGVAAVAAATIVTTVATPAQARTTTKSAPKAAAGWLAHQLSGPNHDHFVAYGGKDPGLAIDAVLAMDAAGVARNAATRVTRWVRRHAVDYATAGGAKGTYDPGHLAKLLLFAEAQQVSFRHFGGLDLVGTLQGEEKRNGKFARPDGSGAAPVSQAEALIALSHTGHLSDWPDARAIRWLVGQQCGDGGFFYAVDPTPAKHCNDVDSTGFAAQGLLTVHSSAAAGAVHWLRRHENPDGGFGFAFGTTNPSSNANSTAVAVQALLQAGHGASAGLHWLRAQQRRCGAPAGQRGSVPYDNTGFNEDSALYATAQAGQALGHKWLGHISVAGANKHAPYLAC